MIFFFKADGTLIKSAPDTVYQGSAEAGKVYVVAPLNSGMLVDVYYELPNGERWGAYLLENNGTVINNEELPDGWALWSTTLESAITQYAGTLKVQFGFYQSGKADKVPLITSQGVTITIAKGVVRDLPSAPTADVYAQIVNSISSIKQDIANLPNEYLSNTNEDKIALKNNKAIEYSENATARTIAKRDSDGKINVSDGTEDLNAVNVGQLNAALAKKVDVSSVSSIPGKDTIAQRTETGQLKAAAGVADDDLATIKQLNAVQGNYTDITNIDLNTGDTTVEYDTELGITVTAKGTVTHKNGNAEQPTTKFELPIIAGPGLSMDKKATEEKVEIKSLNSNLENGTGDVLIKTTDTNHSFKVMTDGRAKVQSAPVENDDVVRKKELNMKTSQEVFIGESLPTGTDARIWIDTGISTSELSKIYGVDKVGQENPTLTRTNDAVGLSYTIGASEITSDFDNCYPWSNMQEVTDSYGNVFIKIPKFYSKVTKNTDGTYKHQISGTQHEGFTTLFVDGKGNELDYILVGKYEGSAVVSGDNNYDAQNQKVKSKSGQTVLVSITRGTYRTRCRNVGKGYQQYDFLIDAIIKELFMIEFATTNSQSIMKGYTNSTNVAAIATGRTDAVKTTSGSEVNNTDGKHACKYRGIENPFGNVWKWCDGINFDTEKIYVCEDPEHYADDKHDAPYTYMGDRLMSEGYLKEVTPFAKNPLLGYATAIGAGSTTYYSDYYYVNNAGTALRCGGHWSEGALSGLWRWCGIYTASSSDSYVGGRLCYKPL